ncbi:hypothetical protein DKT77_11350 [Meridianimarinicoccus roseus]|uniref:Uncharacterized protein n=1 Tax=Meridianimarinicoccus roseus TaxID=2072018 RepID=A0A2V2LG85_9RHOB|nr:hypothetical protein [Meridianimarinicoccus roseus]PWR02514.1 hypothetical protein DKT77_11350 [Meridianimarinicoccus roseus]
MFRFLFRLVLLVCLVGPFAFAWGALQPDPALPASATMNPRMAVQARGLAVRMRTAMEAPPSADGLVRVVASQTELNSAIAAMSRLVRPLRGQSIVDDGGVRVAISGQVPHLPDLGWINFSAQAAPSVEGLDITRITLGRMSLPPGPTVAALRGLLDLATPDDMGTLIFGSISGLVTEPGKATLVLDAGSGDEGQLFARIKTGLRQLAGVGDAGAAAEHYTAMSDAARAGELPARGSALPWIRFALVRVSEAGHDTRAALRADLQAAFAALGAHCGSRSATETVIGPLPVPDVDSPCAGTQLGGRSDLRQHFTLSAALTAAGGAGVSFGFGEVKELLDAGRSGGSGFSFDDIAMDRAGIALAERALAGDAADLASLVGRIAVEADVAPDVSGLPSLMSEAEFAARYGAVDSPRYDAQIAEIDARIAALPVHAD